MEFHSLGRVFAFMILQAFKHCLMNGMQQGAWSKDCFWQTVAVSRARGLFSSGYFPGRSLMIHSGSLCCTCLFCFFTLVYRLSGVWEGVQYLDWRFKAPTPYFHEPRFLCNRRSLVQRRLQVDRSLSHLSKRWTFFDVFNNHFRKWTPIWSHPYDVNSPHVGGVCAGSVGAGLHHLLGPSLGPPLGSFQRPGSRIRLQSETAFGVTSKRLGQGSSEGCPKPIRLLLPSRPVYFCQKDKAGRTVEHGFCFP